MCWLVIIKVDWTFFFVTKRTNDLADSLFLEVRHSLVFIPFSRKWSLFSLWHCLMSHFGVNLMIISCSSSVTFLLLLFHYFLILILVTLVLFSFLFLFIIVLVLLCVLQLFLLFVPLRKNIWSQIWTSNKDPLPPKSVEPSFNQSA